MDNCISKKKIFDNLKNKSQHMYSENSKTFGIEIKG